MTVEKKLPKRNDEEVIQEFMAEGYTRKQALENLKSIDRGMADVRAGRCSKIKGNKL